MQLAARSYAMAAAILAAGSMTAVTSAVFLPDIQARDVELSSADDVLASTDDFLSNLIGPAAPIFADPLLNIQAGELSANTALVGEEITANTGLVTGEESLVSSITSAFPDTTGTTADAVAVGGLSDPTQVLDRLLDANNLLLGGSENLFNSILGADNFDPVAINSSLLLGGLAGTSPVGYNVAPDLAGGGGVGGPFVSGDVGGVQGAAGNDLAALSYALDGTLSASVPALGNAFIAFNTDLINDELAFNTNLLNEEVAAEVAAFGSNNALNGTVDRVINIGNLPLSTAENSFNSVIGADYDSTLTLPAGVTLPEDITASLLTGTGDPSNVFDTGNLGGVEGFFDQNAALFADVAGLNSAEITSALAPGVFEPAEFTTAIGSLFDFGAFGNLAPDFGTISTDFGAVLMSMF
ncbi:MAG: hypothetical protein WA317_20050 [Mycobacterium sp.]|uniref:hypothetical protein n=1 Tax=Mycobacterium sp. TaxID=1785 RepID=UPI003CC6DADE